MGIPDAARAPSPVPRDKLRTLGIPDGGELYAWMLRPEVVFESMVRGLSDSEERTQQILQNRLYRHLSSIVAGMQEYTAAEALYELASEGKYDLVVLDTPPSRNALEFLEAPRKLAMFLDERVVGVFLPEKKGALWRTASSLIENVFTRIFGEGFYGELQSFLGAFSGMFGAMRGHADAVRDLLSGPDAAFILVTSPEPSALSEAAFFQSRIEELSLPFAGYILNRSWAYTRGFSQPEDITVDGTADIVRSAVKKLSLLAEEERARAARDRDLLLRLRQKTRDDAAIATPHLGGAVEDLRGLAELARNLVAFSS
jgi:anion-transporting  ArsA/GET3 family ATPase